eukprot:1998154-Lingulodinium_polyedra.AAC.1
MDRGVPRDRLLRPVVVLLDVLGSGPCKEPAKPRWPLFGLGRAPPALFVAASERWVSDSVMTAAVAGKSLNG